MVLLPPFERDVAVCNVNERRYNKFKNKRHDVRCRIVFA